MVEGGTAAVPHFRDCYPGYGGMKADCWTYRYFCVVFVNLDKEGHRPRSVFPER